VWGVKFETLSGDTIAVLFNYGVDSVVTNIYWHLRKALQLANTIMITMSNDRIGSIVDDASYDMPIFEIFGSPLARGCAEDGIVDGLVEMIHKSN
jgi:hypothetical protein